MRFWKGFFKGTRTVSKWLVSKKILKSFLKYYLKSKSLLNYHYIKKLRNLINYNLNLL